MKTICTVLKVNLSPNLIILIMLLVGFTNCSKDQATPTPAPVQQQNPEPEPEPEPVLSSEKQMTGFEFKGIESNGVTVDIPGEIDEEAKTITIEMPNKTEITSLEPILEIPDYAVYEPTGPQDFSTPIIYTVTAEDGTSRAYLVTMDVALSQREILLLISDVNPGNTLNWNETDNTSDWDQVVLDGNGDIVELNINNRALTIIPPEIGQLFSLERLLISNMNISNLPPEIGLLRNLIEFRAQVNLSSLPPEIGQLSSLERLYLSANELSSLPPEIGQLSSLERLSLSGNDLTSIPSTFKQLVNLKALGLSDNNLSAFNHVAFIPSGGIISILSCATETNLEELRLSGNPSLENLNQCICDLDTDKGGTVDIDVVPDGVNCVGNTVIGD